MLETTHEIQLRELDELDQWLTILKPHRQSKSAHDDSLRAVLRRRGVCFRMPVSDFCDLYAIDRIGFAKLPPAQIETIRTHVSDNMELITYRVRRTYVLVEQPEATDWQYEPPAEPEQLVRGSSLQIALLAMVRDFVDRRAVPQIAG